MRCSQGAITPAIHLHAFVCKYDFNTYKCEKNSFNVLDCKENMFFSFIFIFYFELFKCCLKKKKGSQWILWYDMIWTLLLVLRNVTKTSISDFWMLLTYWIWTFRTEKTSFSVLVERVETEVCNPTFKVSPLGLKIAVSIRTENRISKRVAIKNIFYWH